MDNLRTNLRTNGVLFLQSQQPRGIVWRGRRDLNPLLSSNISDLTPKSVRIIAYKWLICVQFAYK